MTRDVIADIRRKHAQWIAAEWHLTAGVTTEMIQYIGTLLDCIEQAYATADGVNLTEGHIRDNATPDQLREMLLGAGLEIERLKAEVARLREALQPFAIQWDIIAKNAAHDSEPVAADIVMFRLCNSYAAISVRDCRKAWETLHPEKP